MNFYNNIKVSIVTISYNQADYIEKCIKSVINQDYKNLEYILIDANSNDGTREIIEKYRQDIDVIMIERDKGPADGLNKGFNLSSGQVFGFINADDYLLPNAVSTVIKSNKINNHDVVSGNGYIVDKNGIIKNHFISRRFNLKHYCFGASVLCQQSTFFTRKIYNKVGGFNVNNKIAWDGEFWVDCALNSAKFSNINKYFSCFRVYGNTITSQNKSRFVHFEEMYKKVFKKKIPKNYKILSVIYKIFQLIKTPAIIFYRLKYGKIIK